MAEGADEGQRRVINLGGGRWFYSSWGEGGDAPRGRAVSPEIELLGDIMTVRVGGGRRPGEVGLRLWVDGRIERAAVGEDSEVLVRREWDISELRGRRGRLELFDRSSRGWGHVLFDEVRQYRVEGGQRPELRRWPRSGPAAPAEVRREAERRGLEPIERPTDRRSP